MAKICKTKKQSGIALYQYESGSSIYLSLEEIEVRAGIPRIRVKNQVYNGKWPKDIINPPPAETTAKQDSPDAPPCSRPGCPNKADPRNKYCSKSCATKHRHELSPNPHKSQFCGDKLFLKNKAKARKVDRSTHCIRNQVSCAHYHRWLSEKTGFYCECLGYKPE